MLRTIRPFSPTAIMLSSDCTVTPKSRVAPAGHEAEASFHVPLRLVVTTAGSEAGVAVGS